VASRSEDGILGILKDWERDHPGEAFGPALDEFRDTLSRDLRNVSLAVIRRRHDQYAKRKAAILAGHPYLERVSSYSPVRHIERELALIEACVEAAKTEIVLRSRRKEPHQAPDLTVPNRKGQTEERKEQDADHSNEPFSHSEDYRSVIIRGTTFILTPRQAQFIQILYDGYKNGMRDVAIDSILVKLDTQNSRWQDTWKSNPKARKALIVLGASKGRLRLNL
jgi:hypothetical protein